MQTAGTVVERGEALRCHHGPTSNGTQVNAAKARSSVREDGPAVSQSMNPTNVPSRQTAFHGATSWWPITKPGRQVCPANQDTFAGTLLNWATESVSGEVDFRQEVAWLATVLEGRDFRTDRLARDLDICADVVMGQHGSGWRTRRSGTRRGVHSRRRFRPLRGLPGVHRLI